MALFGGAPSGNSKGSRSSLVKTFVITGPALASPLYLGANLVTKAGGGNGLANLIASGVSTDGEPPRG